ncbi:MAG: hypothetical protein ACK54R_00790 [Pirellulaceae bacterium]
MMDPLRLAAFWKRWSLASGVACIGLMASPLQLNAQEEAQSEAPAAAAQPAYDTRPIGEAFQNERAVRDFQKTKKEMLRGEGEFNADQIRQYYQQYLFPKMVQVDHPEEINLVRAEIFDDLFQMRTPQTRAEDRAVHVKMVADLMTGIIERGNFHPAAKVNAALILGSLDSEFATTKTPPVPYRAALGPLVRLVQNPPSDGLLVAALQGLERHASVSAVRWDDRTRSNMSNVIVKVLTSQPPARRSVAAHSYIQRKCLQLLSHYSSPEHAAAKDFVLNATTDPKADPMLRLACVKLISNSFGDMPIDTDQASKGMSGAVELTWSQTRQWIAAVKSQLQKPGEGSLGGLGGMGGLGGPGLGGPGVGGGSAGLDGGGGGYEGMAGGGGRGGDGGSSKKEYPIDTQPPEVRILRRQLNQILEFVHLGMDGKPKGEGEESPASGFLAALKDHETKAQAQEVLQRIAELQEAVNSDKIKDMESLRKATETKIRNFGKMAAEYPGVEELVGDEQPVEEDSAAPADAPEAPEGNAGGENAAAGGDASAPAEGGEAPAEGAAGGEQPPAGEQQGSQQPGDQGQPGDGKKDGDPGQGAAGGNGN